MTPLRTQLRSARQAYRLARYPGDLANQLLPRASRAPKPSPRRWLLLGGVATTAAAAAVLLSLLMSRVSDLPRPTRSDLPEYAWREDLGWLVVADIMSTRPVIVAWPDEPLRLAAEHMLQAGVGRLPVVLPDQPERVVGILTRGDVLKALAQRAEDENKRERLIRGTAPKAA